MTILSDDWLSEVSTHKKLTTTHSRKIPPDPIHVWNNLVLIVMMADTDKSDESELVFQ